MFTLKCAIFPRQLKCRCLKFFKAFFSHRPKAAKKDRPMTSSVCPWGLTKSYSKTLIDEHTVFLSECSFPVCEGRGKGERRELENKEMGGVVSEW